MTQHQRSESSQPQEGSELFPKTRPGIFGDLLNPEDGKAEAALNLLCSIYSQPLTRYARSLGEQNSDAEDLTQSFLAFWATHDHFQRWDSTKGSFRSFLITSFRNYRVSQLRFQLAMKRGKGMVVSLESVMEETGEALLPVVEERARSEFDAGVARRVSEHCLDLLRAEFVAAEKEAEFSILSPFILDYGVADYEEIGRLLNRRGGAIKVQLHRMRKRFDAILRSKVALCSTNPRNGRALADELKGVLEQVKPADGRMNQHSQGLRLENSRRAPSRRAVQS